MPPSPDKFLDFGEHRATIEELYWAKDKELPEVMKIMEAKHGFLATKKQYKKQLKEWGLVKNIKTHEAIAMIQIQKRRRDLENKETRFTLRGREVPDEKLSRFRKRHKMIESEEHGLAAITPSDIVYGTPEPSTPEDSTLSTATSDPDTQGHTNITNEDAPTMMTSLALGQLSPYGQYPVYGQVSWSDVNNFGSHPPPSDPESEYPLTPSRTTFSVPPISNLSPGFFSPLGSGFQHHMSVHALHVQCPTPNFAPRNTLDNNPSDTNSTWNFGLYDHGIQDSVSAPPRDPSGSVEPQYYGYHIDPEIRESHWNPGPGSIRRDTNFHGRQISTVSSTIIDSIGTQTSSHVSNPAEIELIKASLAARIAQGFDLNHEAQGSFRDRSPLHSAVINGDENLTRALLELGANPSPAASGGITPLHYAVFQRNIRLVSLLREHGANLDAVTDHGRSILFFAVCSQDRLNSRHKMAYPVQGGIPVSRTDKNTVETIDALFDWPHGWAQLLRSDDQADNEGVTPLMAAAEEGFTRTVTLLLQRGARPDKKDYAGHTALKYAASCNSRELVRLLLQADTRVRAHDVSHMLKLASRNLTARPAPDGPPRHMMGAVPVRSLRDACHNFDSDVMSEEMVRLYREIGVLDPLVMLAKQKGQFGMVVELLDNARRKLEEDERRSRENDEEKRRLQGGDSTLS
ncbi:hypothetical protein B0H66DRAFT_356712 [Apodospora peruviana]|uniref:Clr5 domain-containing protein n=1 Tax=Apodospora peruviana TaxID=516989 RepID=A0AAE0LZE5_9PEZI|nr:hypothetical protein B0H66DRAFT_356712 [Apodospora peruviana]